MINHHLPTKVGYARGNSSINLLVSKMRIYIKKMFGCNNLRDLKREDNNEKMDRKHVITIFFGIFLPGSSMNGIQD